MRCAGCNRVMEEGDLCIRATASNFLGLPDDSPIDNVMAEVFGGTGGKVVFCAACTTPVGGKYHFEAYHETEGDPR